MDVWERMKELQREIRQRQFRAVYGAEPSIIRVTGDAPEPEPPQ